MKRLSVLFLILINILLAENRFTKGVNLTLWFQDNDIRKINFSKFDKEDFENIKFLGCDVVRLPIRLNDFSDGAPNYIIDPLLYYFLDQVVDWCEELEINLILDNHTFDSDVDTDSTITDPLIKVWAQMADHYKDRSDYVLYEILNEPHNIDGELWGEIQGDIINEIRKYDTMHTIVVGGHSWNSYTTLADIPEYEDDNLIYTFHFYDPFIFTHQGASWSDPSMVPLSDVPFPYIDFKMPVFPDALKGSWIESAFNNYMYDGTIGKVQEFLDIADDFQKTRNVPIFCGELGVYNVNCQNSDRAFWYNIVTNYLNENEIPWTMWDYQGAFGIFYKGSNEMFEHDLNVELLEAIGFNVPAQTEYVAKPDSDAIIIYSDYTRKNIQLSPYSANDYALYNDDDPKSGDFCIKWENPSQYEALSFDFLTIRDLSYLAASEYDVEFYIKTNNPNLKLDVRFVDTDTDDPNDHPWRMNYTINNTNTTFDGQWQLVAVPLSDFTEQGSWDDNAWYTPEGKFDWTNIDYLSIVSEHQAFTNTEIYIDELGIFPSTNAPDDMIGADFTVNITQGEIPLEVQFTEDCFGTITSYLWDFGDGITSTEQNPMHIYEIADTFSVSLTINGVETKTYENLIIAIDPTSINNAENIPTEFKLYPNYPNPFNPSTTLKYSLPQSTQVKLSIFNNLGQEVTKLVDQSQQAGNYQVTWNTSNHPSGIYIFVLETKDFKEVTKGILLK